MADLHGTPQEWLAFLISKGAAAASGLAGAYIRNLFPPFKPWSQRIPEYVGGALTAVYAGPVAGPVLSSALDRMLTLVGISLADTLPRQNVESLAGFLCGVIGLTIIEGIFVIVRRWRDDPRLPLG